VINSFSLNPGELQLYLKQRLPEYMIPTAFCLLDELPITSNGKLDTKALPVPEMVSSQVDASAPRSPVEQILLDTWTELLAVRQLGINDNFFALGGHSLLATRVISRLRALFQIELSLRTLFEHPTIAKLAGQVEAAMRIQAGLNSPPMRAVSRELAAPLSYAQERLWFLDQLIPGSSMYILPIAVRLNGELDLAALERVLAEITRRHESLRTTFEMRGQELVQVVGDACATKLDVEDLTKLSEAERQSVVDLRINAEAAKPFDLGRGPLMRVQVLKTAEQEHVILLTMHHIISDGWSMSLLIEEVGTLYSAYVEGRPSPLPDLDLQYGDFAVWQRNWLSGSVLEQQLDYWRRQLGEDLPVLDIATDHPRPARPNFYGAVHSFNVSKDLTLSLQNLSQAEGVTTFMLVLAAWQTLLSRYSGQADICVGTPIANRNWADIEKLIGFFVNTLVLRTDLHGDPDFREVLRRVKEVCLGAYAHQDMPFEKLVIELQPDRDLSRTPLFQTMLVLQNVPVGQPRMKGLSVTEIPGHSQTAKFDLLLSLMETKEALRVALQFDSEIFERSRIQRMGEHFVRLLEEVARDPNQRISEIGMLRESERQQLLVDWNRSSLEYPKEKCVHELFAEQALRRGEATAVTYDAERLSYAELNARTDQLANYLQRLGIKREDRVGVYLERSVSMIVSFLAVLKAGAAYVPLDLTYPRERISLMLDDAQIEFLLTEQKHLEALPEHTAREICLDSEWEMIAQESTMLNRVQCDPDNLAYVIYTSGSTGTPKGVCISHQNIVHLVHQVGDLSISEEDVVSQGSTASFDAATFEIWATLLNGARISGIDKEVLLNATSLARHIKQEGLNALFLATALFNQISLEKDATFDGVRAMWIGGSVLEPVCVSAVMERGYQGRIVNVYGPTETTVFALYHTITAVAPETRMLPIGRPVVNTDVYILDRQMNPVPVGVVGELYIGGDALARGYLSRPALTAVQFIPHPYSATPGARLYRTGDLARYREDGCIEYLGRIDQQVKVLGYRVEPGEVEAVLLQHSRVRECFVLAVEKEKSDKQLAAYVVADDEEITPAVLRAYLAEKLPAYMVPAVFVFLDRLPLNINGKIDRNALPVATEIRTITDEVYLAPQTEIQQVLASIWSEVLGVEQVGICDNFFELGGHSLMATQVMSRIRRRFQVEVPLRNIFETPTIEKLSEAIESELSREQSNVDKIARALEQMEQLSAAEVEELLRTKAAAMAFGSATNGRSNEPTHSYFPKTISFDQHDISVAHTICQGHLDSLDDNNFREACATADIFLPNYDDAPKIVDRIVEAAQRGDAFSLVRIGDGEGNVLRLSSEFGAPTTLIDEKCFDATFSMQNKTHFLEGTAGKVQFASLLATAVSNATLLGVRAVWSELPPESELIRRTLKNGDIRGALGLLNARLFAERLIRGIKSRPAGITFAHCYLALVDDLHRMLDDVPKILIISGRDSLRNAFQNRLRNRLVDFITIPLEGKGNPKEPMKSHYYEHFPRILDQLSTSLSGTLVLVGAGIFGKIYCEAVRSAGGVAVDLGSGFDLLAGVSSRPIHSRFHSTSLLL
jgi:amino acid adenylation domain-containing protein